MEGGKGVKFGPNFCYIIYKWPLFALRGGVQRVSGIRGYGENVSKPHSETFQEPHGINLVPRSKAQFLIPQGFECNLTYPITRSQHRFKTSWYRIG